MRLNDILNEAGHWEVLANYPGSLTGKRGTKSYSFLVNPSDRNRSPIVKKRKKNKLSESNDSCPVCGATIKMRCRCQTGHRVCVNGHATVRCSIHGYVTAFQPADNSHPVCGQCEMATVSSSTNTQ